MIAKTYGTAINRDTKNLSNYKKSFSNPQEKLASPLEINALSIDIYSQVRDAIYKSSKTILGTACRRRNEIEDQN